jgi:RNA polymerase sigma factor (sigma-70 family)
VLPDTVAEDVLAAAAGDSRAWDRLVERFSGLVWAVARSHRLSEADAADVSQTTWLRLAEHLQRLRQPERVGGWLATTARNESLRVLRRCARLVPMADALDSLLDEGCPEVDRRLLDQERDAALWEAFLAMPHGCQRLLRTLMADPAPSYAEVSAALGMPVGSIGPRRGRCLEHLRSTTEGTAASPRPEPRLVG